MPQGASMVEKFCILIINELGPVGLLVLGLYFILGRHMQKISECLKQINHNSTKGIEIMERCADRICDKLDGKN